MARSSARVGIEVAEFVIVMQNSTTKGQAKKVNPEQIGIFFPYLCQSLAEDSPGLIQAPGGEVPYSSALRSILAEAFSRSKHTLFHPRKESSPGSWICS